MNNWREFLFKNFGLGHKILIFFFIFFLPLDHKEGLGWAFVTFLIMYEFIIVEPEKFRLEIKSKIDERKKEISDNRKFIKEEKHQINNFKLMEISEATKKRAIKACENSINKYNERNTLCRKELKFLENVKIPLMSFYHKNAIDKINETLWWQKNKTN